MSGKNLKAFHNSPSAAEKPQADKIMNLKLGACLFQAVSKNAPTKVLRFSEKSSANFSCPVNVLCFGFEQLSTDAELKPIHDNFWSEKRTVAAKRFTFAHVLPEKNVKEEKVFRLEKIRFLLEKQITIMEKEKIVAKRLESARNSIGGLKTGANSPKSELNLSAEQMSARSRRLLLTLGDKPKSAFFSDSCSSKENEEKYAFLNEDSAIKIVESENEEENNDQILDSLKKQLNSFHFCESERESRNQQEIDTNIEQFEKKATDDKNEDNWSFKSDRDSITRFLSQTVAQRKSLFGNFCDSGVFNSESQKNQPQSNAQFFSNATLKNDESLEDEGEKDFSTLEIQNTFCFQDFQKRFPLYENRIEKV